MMKGYTIIWIFIFFLFVAIGNYFQLAESHPVRTVQVVHLLGIGFLAGVIVLRLVQLLWSGSGEPGGSVQDPDDSI